MVAGREVTPKDAENTDKLKAYWDSGGEGQVQWGHPGDFDACVLAVQKAVGARMTLEQIKGYCANRHHDATGAWPGHAPGEDIHRGKH